MSTNRIVKGTILSSTVIRVPGAAHAASAPFTLLLVEVEGGRHVLGHFEGAIAPDIGATVIAQASEGNTLVFRSS
jgi:uncharacterized OB-fold protein